VDFPRDSPPTGAFFFLPSPRRPVLEIVFEGELRPLPRGRPPALLPGRSMLPDSFPRAPPSRKRFGDSSPLPMSCISLLPIGSVAPPVGLSQRRRGYGVVAASFCWSTQVF